MPLAQIARLVAIEQLAVNRNTLAGGESRRWLWGKVGELITDSMRNDSSPYTVKSSDEPSCASVRRRNGGWRRRDAHRRSLESSPRVRRAIRLERPCPRRGGSPAGSRHDRRSMLRAKSMSSRRPIEARLTYRSFLLDLDRPRVSRANT